MTKERENYYIIKQSKGTLWAFFYDHKDGICCTTYTYDAWSNRQIIFKDGTKNFSVYLDNSDQIHIFCQDTSGNILLYRYTSNEWKSEILLYSKTGFLDSLHFDAIIQGEDLFLFYNLKDPNNNRHALVQQVAVKGTHWNTPSLIDYIEPLGHQPFSVYRDSNNHILLFYQKVQDGCQLGYKKYSQNMNTWSNFYPFDENRLSFGDESILLNNQNIQCLYIKKEKHYSTLFYRFKNESKWETPQKLFEKAEISSCSLFMIDDHLWAAWISDGKLYSCYSTDWGQTFSNPSVHFSDRPTQPVKASYQSNFLQEQKRLRANKIYIRPDEQIEFLIIPDVFPIISGKSAPLEDTFIPVTDKVDNYLNEIKMHMNEVYEEIYICKKQLREKEHQIAQLKYTLKTKNQDLSRITYELNKANEAHKKELLSLKEKNKSLEKELQQKNNEIKVLEEKIIAQRKGMNILKQELEVRKAPLIITANEEANSSRQNKTSLLRRIFSFEDEHIN
ncbi:hypothetical protein [Defluviitalea saccharophila]|uniref:Sialidase domain-containing protein n=1 Tax=Defluviitalea saccharophila TaxID=879970 RepID=A0ABZ2YAF2_9FIRM